MFSLNPHNGESEKNNVFVGLSTMLKSLRDSVVEVGGETARQVFEAGSDMFKSIRDTIKSSVGIDPSKSDADVATNKMGKLGGGAQGAFGNPSSSKNKLAGSASSGSSSNSSQAAGKKLAEEQRWKLLNEQRNLAAAK